MDRFGSNNLTLADLGRFDPSLCVYDCPPSHFRPIPPPRSRYSGRFSTFGSPAELVLPVAKLHDEVMPNGANILIHRMQRDDVSDWKSR
jgi:hypothetical protein